MPEIRCQPGLLQVTPVAETSKQNVLNKAFYCTRHFVLATNNHNQLASEFRFGRDPLNRAAFWMQREHTVWHNADAQTERDKVDNQVEVVGIHRSFDLYS